MEFDEKQQAAINGCIDTKQRLVGVSGPGGSGKTEIMGTVGNALIDAGHTVIATAPTGRAAKNIEQRTGIQAMTMHRLLEYGNPGERDPKTGKTSNESFPKRDRTNPLPYDVIIADEYAMVNQEVNRNLLDAIKPGACIREVGDINQLKPIEGDKRLQAMPSAFKKTLSEFPSYILGKVYRTGEGSGITENANRVLHGRMPQRNNDFTIEFTSEVGSRGPVCLVESIVLEALEDEIDYRSLDNQVITLTNPRWIGTYAISAMLQKALNDMHPYEMMALPRHSWHEHKVSVGKGDKVVFKKNVYSTEENPDFEVFNGEIGIVQEITEYGEIVVDLGDRIVHCPPVINYIDGKSGEIRSFDPRKDIELAYCITTHGAQGSQYKQVVYLLNKSNFFLQCRANMYTGLTRASQHCTLVTDQKSIGWSTSRITAKIEEQ